MAQRALERIPSKIRHSVILSCEFTAQSGISGTDEVAWVY